MSPSEDTGVRRGLVEAMDEIRQDQIARGYAGRTLQAMQAEEQLCREEDEEYERRCETITVPAQDERGP